MKNDVASSVEKAFSLLEFLASSGKPVSLQEATEAAGLPKPTAYRLLQTLQEMGYATRPAGSRDYLVGPRTSLLATADPHSRLKSNVRPLLRRLHEEFNETVNLGVLSEGQVLYLDYIETTQPLRFIVTPGQNDPYYSTALGLAISSRLSDKALNRLLADTSIAPLTPNTVKTATELRERIARTRKSGIAEENEESVSGVCCLAISLADLGFADAAISIAVPSQRLSASRKAKLLTALQQLIQPKNHAHD